MTHLLFSCPLNHLIFRLSVIIQHDKARSASDRPATRDAQHPESGVLNSYSYLMQEDRAVDRPVFLGTAF
jgi:hypothetical protein